MLSDIVGGLFGLGGSALSAHLAAKEAAKNRKFQERMYKTRYQNTMADMAAAGLNPILMQPGVGSAPSGSMAAVPDFGKSITGGVAASAARRSSQAQQRVSSAQAALLDQQGRTETWKQLQLNSSAQLNQQNIIRGQIENAMERMRLETWQKLPADARVMLEVNRAMGGGISGLIGTSAAGLSAQWSKIKQSLGNAARNFQSLGGFSP